MVLREIPQGSQLRVEVEGSTKPAVFDHLDGSYSHCHLADDTDAVFHLYHGQELTQCADGVYELAAAR